MKPTETDKNQLSERQIKALPYLMGSNSDVYCCQQAKISRQTYYDWLKEPAFKAELRSLRNLVVYDAVETLKASTTKAVATLVALLDAENAALQRNVANDILQHVSRFQELQEIERRLDALESQ